MTKDVVLPCVICKQATTQRSKEGAPLHNSSHHCKKLYRYYLGV